jgi:hypothetical protein
MNHLDTDIEDYPDDETDGDYAGPADHRWRPVAAIAGGVLVLAVIATIVIVNGGDSASTSATVVPSPPRTVIATPRPTTPTASPIPSLPPETVTTLPPHTATARPTAEPSTAPTATPPPAASPSTPPAVNPRTVVYTVTGTKQLLDLVTIIYTDAQGIPHTDFNVALPWTKTVVLNPGVQTKSVVATSLYGQLNCAIVNAEGQTIVASANHTMIATCAR